MDYITFVLGYDLLHDYFEMFEDAPCDLVYEACEEIAREFNMYDMEHPSTCSEYEALDEWLNNNMDFVEETRQKHLTPWKTSQVL